MQLIDLHVHSTASDGSCTPAQVVALAKDASLAAIALTDHDTISGIDDALVASKNQELPVIPGVELSCIYKEKEIHILGLYIDHKNQQLLDFLAVNSKKREARNRTMLDAFRSDGFDLTMDDLLCGNPNTIITRAHFARALLSKGYVKTVDQAFKKYLNPDCPYYRKREIITPEESISVINQAGGIAVLAHPCLYKLGWNETEELILCLKNAGLFGVECFHSSNNQYESGKLRTITEKHGLAITGGSDFHGAAKPDIKIGCGRGGLRVPALYLDDLKHSMSLR